MIKLIQCEACKKLKTIVKTVNISSKGISRNGKVCLACLDSYNEVRTAIKKLSSEQQTKLTDYIIRNLTNYK